MFPDRKSRHIGIEQVTSKVAKTIAIGTGLSMVMDQGLESRATKWGRSMEGWHTTFLEIEQGGNVNWKRGLLGVLINLMNANWEG